MEKKQEKTITLSRFNYKGSIHIGFQFEYNTQLNSLLKKLNAVWSQSYKCWHIEDTADNLKKAEELQAEGIKLEKVKSFFEPVVLPASEKKEAKVELSDETIEKIEKFKYFLRSRRYSESTIKTYMDCLRSFLKFHSGKQIKDINNNDIVAFNNEYIIENKLSSSFQNQVVNAVKLFFRKVENTSMEIDLIHRPKRAKLLPNVLSKEEVQEILNASQNFKHKTMLALIYSCGLRRSELLNLRIPDIDSKRGLIIVREAKGNKDRIVPLSGKITGMLRQYYKLYKPKTWLFEGQNEGKQYTATSLEKVLKKALGRTSIKRPVTLHWLRHSYATHILENGTDLRYIQEILGHKSSKTTEIYTHVSMKSIQKIKSPLEDMDI